MIDLETGQTFVQRTGADKLIDSLMRHTRSGLGNDPKFKAEPVPGAPLKQLKRNLECELERKRTEMIMKIMQVEKKEKDEEEELLEDEEFELDSDDDTKKKRVKRKKADLEEVEQEERGEGEVEPKKKVVYNEDEEEMEMDEGAEAVEGEEEGEDDDVEGEEGGQEGDQPEDEDEDGEEEQEGEAESESDDDELDTSVTLGKRPLKRIVAMDDDSDDEQQEKTHPGEDNQSVATAPVAPAPLFEDIPTEPMRGFEFSATQNENELFDLCSGKFITQLPVPEEEEGDKGASQLAVEASQVRDFEFPSATPLNETTAEEASGTDKEQEKPTINDPDDAEVAGPQHTALNLLSSDEEEGGDDKSDHKLTKKLKKKKRIFIQEMDDDEEDQALANEGESEDEYGSDEEGEPAEPAIEELEEYKSFLTGKPAAKPPGEKRMRASDFVENEAELSDSEWGSEDEDERGLDKEEDIGLVKDDDNFDGDQLRDEVGRIHMRQMVNEDNRELKYLKDLILNEEETDGQGRQRTFRWQNLNGENDDFNASMKGEGGGAVADGEAGDGNQESDDEENEANWRKVRLEREKALLENVGPQNVTIQTKFDAVMLQTRDIKVVKSSFGGAAGELVAKENSSPSFLMQDQAKKYMVRI